VIINEVGGYFASVLPRIPEHLKPYFGGIVEVTTYGYNRYKQIKDQLKYPVFSVARSSLKEIEAVYVGQAVTLAFDHLMRSLGISIPGREALVIGYGMIGTEVAKALRSSQIHVTIWDKDPIRRLRAFVDGYHTMDGIGSMKKFDVVISATGNQAVNINMMREMKSGVLLISAGSRNTEFDLEGLQRVADKKEIIHPEIPEIIIYTLGNQEIVVLRDGTALNFQIDSVPTEVTDLLLSEILACMIRLVQKRGELEGGLYELDRLGMASIARRWLKQIQGF
jgi:adenosylhomocysteinase